MSKVLICPLNWGIGHATRCMPIIRGLMDRGHEVVLASDGEALKLLKIEFPDLTAYELTSYAVRYPTESIVLNLITRVPKIIRAIKKEEKMVADIAEEEGIDVVISDNRFGCYSQSCKNIFITHQINLISGNRQMDRVVRNLNAKYISRFEQCWVPDFDKAPGLSGILGHDHKLEVQYVGPISRMKRLDIDQEYDFSVVLSGPEPQRSKLEDELISKVSLLDKKVAFVGGSFTEGEGHSNLPSNIKYFKLLNSEKLNEVYCASGFVVSRSGYSSMMDLAVLGKKAVIIPTPGQTEQEYLAKIYQEQKWHLMQRQGKVDLMDMEAKLMDYTGIPMVQGMPELERALDKI